MAWKRLADLVLVWWNTGLSPPILKKVKKDQRRIAYVARYISDLYSTRQFHMFGLCEVDELDVKDILKEMGNSNFDYYFPTSPSNRVKMDVAVIFDTRFLVLRDKENWIDTYGKFETIKTGVALSFFVPLINDMFVTVLSHWPSQIVYAEESSHRGEIASSCRRWIQDTRNMNKNEDMPIILMGDYNAEPFSGPLSRNLLATRDRKLVQDDFGMLYNPFWRLMGESVPHDPDSVTETFGGTCFSAGDRYRRWASFDQMIFSGSFLKSSSMVLDESKTYILADPELMFEIKKKEFIDHLPVSSTIQLRDAI